MKCKHKPNNRTRAGIGFITISMLTLAGVVIGESTSQTAMASDNKILPGHACMPVGLASLVTDYSNPEFIRNATLLAQAHRYMCPVVRDDTNGELDFVRVRTENNESTGAVPTCTVWSVSVDGNAIDFETVVADPGLGFRNLEFSLSGFIEFDHGHYVIECSLGKNDRIYSYRTNED
ncbi:hypothetical protein [Enhygromyxa salina]|uniref:Uncharacterized protein n=1 Tax=Enhygromyxa salina TaxID=215803 RepID=A0A2S9YVS7_9BACT|nr:hypothetical protein [Enhygromyxa salina]PRQ09152.1 hypothetical protein ENSA7_11420 [Enhygromyxa salina]